MIEMHGSDIPNAKREAILRKDEELNQPNGEGWTKEESDITVFICEDDKVRKEITEKYFERGKITYASLFPKTKLTEITDALDEISDD